MAFVCIPPSLDPKMGNPFFYCTVFQRPGLVGKLKSDPWQRLVSG